MRTWIALLIAAAFISSASTRAEIYRCQEADGSLTYSQTPCSKEAPVKINASGPGTSGVDCSYVDKFAVSTARLMRNGAASDEVFNRYGGLGALSNGSIGVINYVYSFRTNNGVPAERIAGLTQAKCKAKGFGDVSCKALPHSFTEGLGGCDVEEEDETSQPPATVDPAISMGEQIAAPTTSNDSRADEQSTRARDEALTEQCKKRYRDQIDAIDAQMRSGYSSEQGEIYREQLRALTERLRAC
ncbi:MAG: DUF4124 domain-containing protein [Gammaproteobacteria bacterium]|jgi:hypothetical protein|nr:DUF4124 domain-containing protein [Gammaproteobacteria bacterium]MDH3750329.1 DUF4124 domain-containing protein [Gammaproteobacteria bacterium]MDH3805467.1 DUF4124 domain-containing protein [Gammaproteobacteria bacterium]